MRSDAYTGARRLFAATLGPNATEDQFLDVLLDAKHSRGMIQPLIEAAGHEASDADLRTVAKAIIDGNTKVALRALPPLLQKSIAWLAQERRSAVNERDSQQR